MCIRDSNNGNPAGDGQAGDAGQGTGGKQSDWLIVYFMQSDWQRNYPIEKILKFDWLPVNVMFSDWLRNCSIK